MFNSPIAYMDYSETINAQVTLSKIPLIELQVELLSFPEL